MSANPVPGHTMRLLAASETTWGTTPDPAAAQYLRAIDCVMGQTEKADSRPRRDRIASRGMQQQFFAGRQQPIDFTVTVPLYARSGGDTAPDELALYRAAGLRGYDAGSTYDILPVSDPIGGAYFAGLSLRRAFGDGDTGHGYECEQTDGGVVRSLSWRGGDQELILTAQGQARRKFTMGGLDSITINNVTTTLTHTAEESYRLAAGAYICESEVIYVTSVGYGSTSSTIARAQLSTSNVSHTAKPLLPYMPTLSNFTRAPISEATSTVTIGGVATRCTSFQLDLTTGMDILPPETGSAYSQGYKVGRYDMRGRASLILKGDDVRLIQRGAQRATTAISIVQGTGTGSTATFTMSYCELDAMNVPAPANDSIAVEVTWRTRDSAEDNTTFSLSLS